MEFHRQLKTTYSVSNNGESSKMGESRISEFKQKYLLDNIPPFRPSDSKKRILCQHYIKNLPTPHYKNYCNYGSKCVYAHGLKSQAVDPIKIDCLNILINGSYNVFNEAKSYVENQESIELVSNSITFSSGDKFYKQQYYKELFSFVDVCDNCVHLEKIRLKYTEEITGELYKLPSNKFNQCIGGLNCRHGSPFMELKICKEQFFNGTCEKTIHDIPIIDPELLLFKTNDYMPSGCDNGLHLIIEPYHIYIENLQKEEHLNKVLTIDINTPDDLIDDEIDEIFYEFRRNYIEDGI